MLVCTHIWDLMKSLGQLWQIFTAMHDEFYGLIICGWFSQGCDCTYSFYVCLGLAGPDTTITFKLLGGVLSVNLVNITLFTFCVNCNQQVLLCSPGVPNSVRTLLLVPLSQIPNKVEVKVQRINSLANVLWISFLISIQISEISSSLE